MVFKKASRAFAALAGLFMTACLGCATAPEGEGSADDNGVPRDPSTILAVGDKAPDFKVKDEMGQEVTMKEFKGKKNVVLIFYPKDDTSGCTKQLCAARDGYEGYKQADAVVFGVNPGDAVSHKAFIDKYSFPFPILVDSEGEVVRAYGCRNPTGGMTIRTVYVIDKKGKIIFAERGMPETAKIQSALGG